MWNPADELLSPACEGLLNEARSVHLCLQEALDRGQPIKTALASLACNMGADSEDEELAELRMFVSDVIAIAKAAKAPHPTARRKAGHKTRVQASFASEDSHPSRVSLLSGVENTKAVPSKTEHHCQAPALPRLASVEHSSRSTAITEAQAQDAEEHPSDSDQIPLHRHLQLSLRRHLRQKAPGRALRGKDSAEKIAANESAKAKDQEERHESEADCMAHFMQCNETVTVVHQVRPTSLQSHTGAQHAEGRNALCRQMPGAPSAARESTAMCLPAGSRHGLEKRLPTSRGGGIPAGPQDLASFHQTQAQVAVAAQPSPSTCREPYGVHQDGRQSQVVAGKQSNPGEFVPTEHRTFLHPAMHPAMPIPERGGVVQSATPQPQQAAAQDGRLHKTVLGQVIAAKANHIQLSSGADWSDCKRGSRFPKLDTTTSSPAVCTSHPGQHEACQVSPAQGEQRCQPEDLPVSALGQTAEHTTSAPVPLSTRARPVQTDLLQTSREAMSGSQVSQSGIRELLDDVRSSFFRAQPMLPAQDHMQTMQNQTQTSERWSGSHTIGQIADVGQAQLEALVSTVNYSDNSHPDAHEPELRGTDAPHAPCQDLAQLGTARIGSSAAPMSADSLCATSAAQASRPCNHEIVHQAGLATCAGTQTAGRSPDTQNLQDMSSKQRPGAPSAARESTAMCLPAGSRHGLEKRLPTSRGGGIPAGPQDLASFHQTQAQVAVAAQPSPSTCREPYGVHQDGRQSQVVAGKQSNPGEFVPTEHRTFLHPAMHPAMPIPERGGVVQSATPQPQQAAAQDGRLHKTVLGQVIAAKANHIQLSSGADWSDCKRGSRFPKLDTTTSSPAVCTSHPGQHEACQVSPAQGEQRCQPEDLPVSALGQTAEHTTSAPVPLSTRARPVQTDLLQTSREAMSGSQVSQSGIRELLDDVRSSFFRAQPMLPAQDHMQTMQNQKQTSERWSGSHTIGQIADVGQAQLEALVSTVNYSDNSHPDAHEPELRGTDAPHAPCQDLAQLGTARIGSSAAPMLADSLCAASAAQASRPCNREIVHQAEPTTCAGAGDWNADSAEASGQDRVRHRVCDLPPVPLGHPLQQQLSSEGFAAGDDSTPSRDGKKDASLSGSNLSRALLRDVALGPLASTLPRPAGPQRQDQTAAAKGKSQTGAEGLSKPGSDTAGSNAELVSDTARLPLDSLATQSVESVPLPDGGIPLTPLADTVLQAAVSGAFPGGGRSTPSRDDAQNATRSPAGNLCATSEAPAPGTCNHDIVHQAEPTTCAGAGDWNADSAEASGQDRVQHRVCDVPPVPLGHPFQQQLSSEGFAAGDDSTPSRDGKKDASLSGSNLSRALLRDVALGPLASTLPRPAGQQRQDQTAAAKGKSQTLAEGLSKPGLDTAGSNAELVSDTARLPLDSLATQSVESVPLPDGGIPLTPLADAVLQAAVSGAFPGGGRSTPSRDDAQNATRSPAGNLYASSEAPAPGTCNHEIVHQAEPTTCAGAGDWNADSAEASGQDIVQHRVCDVPPVPLGHPLQQQLSSEGFAAGDDSTPSRDGKKDASLSGSNLSGALLRDVALGPLASTLPRPAGPQRQDQTAAAKGKSQTGAEGLSKPGSDTAGSNAELVSDTARLPLDSLATQSVESVPLPDGGIPLTPLADTVLQAAVSGAFPGGGRSTPSRDDAQNATRSPAGNLYATSEAPAPGTCNHEIVHQAEPTDWNADSAEASGQDIVQHRVCDVPPVPFGHPLQQQLSSEGFAAGDDSTPSRDGKKDASLSGSNLSGALLRDVALGPLASTLPRPAGQQRQDQTAAAKGKSQTLAEGLSKPGLDIAGSNAELVSDTARLPLDSLATQSVESVPLPDGGIPLTPLADTVLQAAVSGAFPGGGRSTPSRDDAQNATRSPAGNLYASSEAPAPGTCNHEIVHQAEPTTCAGAGDWNADSAEASGQDIVQHRVCDVPPVPLGHPLQQQLSSEGFAAGDDSTPSRDGKTDASLSGSNLSGALLRDVALGPLASTLPRPAGQQRQDQTAAAKGKSQTGAEGLSKPGLDTAGSNAELVSDTARLPLDSLATQSVESVPLPDGGIPLTPLADAVLQAAVSGAFPGGGRSTPSRDDAQSATRSPAGNLCATSEAPAPGTCNHEIVHQAEPTDWNADSAEASGQDIVQHRVCDVPPVPLGHPLQQQLSSEGFAAGDDSTPSRDGKKDASLSGSNLSGALLRDVALGPLASTLPRPAEQQRQDQTAAAKGKSQTGAEGLSKPDTARLPLDSLATQSVESVPDGDSYSDPLPHTFAQLPSSTEGCTPARDDLTANSISLAGHWLHDLAASSPCQAQADGSSSAHGLSERRVSATILTRDGADLDPVVYHFRPDAAEDEPTPERDSTEDLFITLAQIPADDTCSGNSGRQPRTAGTVSVASRLVPENQSQGLLDVRHAQASGMNNAGGADRAVWTPSNRAPLLDDTSDAGTIQQNRDRQGSGPVPTNSDKFVGNEETHMGSCTTASTSLRVRHMSHTRHARSEEVPASSLCISFGELGPEWIAADSVSRKAHELPSVPMQYVGGAAPENVGLRDIALEKTDSLSSVTDSEAEVRAAANVMPSTSLGTTLTQARLRLFACSHASFSAPIAIGSLVASRDRVTQQARYIDS